MTCGYEDSAFQAVLFFFVFNKFLLHREVLLKREHGEYFLFFKSTEFVDSE